MLREEGEGEKVYIDAGRGEEWEESECLVTD